MPPLSRFLKTYSKNLKQKVLKKFKFSVLNIASLFAIFIFISCVALQMKTVFIVDKIESSNQLIEIPSYVNSNQSFFKNEYNPVCSLPQVKLTGHDSVYRSTNRKKLI